MVKKGPIEVPKIGAWTYHREGLHFALTIAHWNISEAL